MVSTTRPGKPIREARKLLSLAFLTDHRGTLMAMNDDNQALLEKWFGTD
jgi:hypothetical protein